MCIYVCVYMTYACMCVHMCVAEWEETDAKWLSKEQTSGEYCLVEPGSMLATLSLSLPTPWVPTP